MEEERPMLVPESPEEIEESRSIVLSLGQELEMKENNSSVLNCKNS